MPTAVSVLLSLKGKGLLMLDAVGQSHMNAGLFSSW